MADKRQDDPKYNNVTGRIGGSLGRDENGRSAYSIFTGRATYNLFLQSDDPFEFALKSMLLGFVGSAVIGAGSAIFVESTDPTDIPFDTELTEKFNQNYGYSVSQEMDTRLALVQNGGQYELYRIDRNSGDHRISEPEGEIVDRWDFIENPLKAELYARDIADSYANALQLAERDPNANLHDFAPVSHSYELISQAYLEDNGEAYRDSRGGAENNVNGALSLEWLKAQEALWRGAAEQIAQGAYSQDLGQELRMTEANDWGARFGESFATSWMTVGGGWLALSLFGAGAYTRQRVSEGRRSRNGRRPS
jgi:hypothetical protein